MFSFSFPFPFPSFRQLAHSPSARACACTKLRSRLLKDSIQGMIVQLAARSGDLRGEPREQLALSTGL